MSWKPHTKDDFDDLVESWHYTSSDFDPTPIHEWMGLSWDEYALWVEEPSAMERINQVYVNQRLSKDGPDIRPELARNRRRKNQENRLEK